MHFVRLEITESTLIKIKHFSLQEEDEILKDVIGNGLLIANGDNWKRHSHLMVSKQYNSHADYLKQIFQHFSKNQKPAFGLQYMNMMVPCFVKQANILCKKWSEHSASPIAVHEDLTCLTLDVIGYVGFNYNFQAQENAQGVLPRAVSTILKETESRIFQLIPIWKIPFYPGTMRLTSSKQTILREITSMIKQRKLEGVTASSPDLLGRLLSAEDEQGQKISDIQLRDELITFLIAGHETTSAMMAFLLYLVATHPKVENKVTLQFFFLRCCYKMRFSRIAVDLRNK